MNQLYINARLRIRRDAVIHIWRQLPGNGSFNVSVGQEISPGEIIGEGRTPVGFRTIHLAAALGLSPKQVFPHLKRKMGQTIYQGELLAERQDLLGLRRRILVSPADGIVDFYDEKTGNLRVKLTPKVVKLISGAYGIIDEINGEKGLVMIRTLAHIVYGILGSGKEREGVIKVLGSAGDLTTSKSVPSSVHGNILVGGGLILPDLVQSVAGFGTGGIITGGIDAATYKATTGGAWRLPFKGWSDVGVTLMVTEGFGMVPIGEDIFSLLKKHNGRFAILDGNRARLILPINDQSSMIYIRRTKLPPSSYFEPEPGVVVVELRTGMRVRIISSVAIGRQGLVETIDRTQTELPSGIKTFMVTVTTSKTKFKVPYQNLEVI